MNALNLNYFTDPGHGWVSIKLSILQDLDLMNQISHYSYTKGKSAYLEEDCDLAALYKACDAKRIKINLTPKHTNKRSPIRSYDSFSKLKA